MRNRLILISVLGWAIAGFAQGTVKFTNYDPSSALNAPIFDFDCTTMISGPQYRVRLLGWPLASTNVSSVPIATTDVGTNIPGYVGTNIPGYFNGGVVTITNTPPGGIAYLQIQVWNTLVGATPEEAKACGCMGTYAQSAIFSVRTGNPLASPPDPPAPLIGLTTFCLNALSTSGTPVLRVHYTETNTLAIAWGSLYSRAVLQQSPDLGATSWNDVTNVPQLVNFRSQVTVPASSSKMFYRLIFR